MAEISDQALANSSLMSTLWKVRRRIVSPCSQNAFISDSKVFKINFKAEPMMQEELYIVLHQVLSAQFYNKSDDI